MREEIIKHAEALKAYCLKKGFSCEGCLFRRDDPSAVTGYYEYCELNETLPGRWVLNKEESV